MTYQGRGNFHLFDKYFVKKKIGIIAEWEHIAPIFAFVQALVFNKDKGIKIQIIHIGETNLDIPLKKEMEDFEREEPNMIDLYYLVDQVIDDDKWFHDIGQIDANLIKKYMPEPSEETLMISSCSEETNERVENILLNEIGYDSSEMFHKL